MIDELKNIKSDSSFIPEGCASFVDEATFIIGAIDEDYDELMESFGISEGEDCAPEAEPDTEPVEDTNESAVVTEKVDIKAAGGAIVEFLKKIWAKIKGAFESIVKWIKERVKDANRKGYKKAISKWDKVEFKADTKLGSLHTSSNLYYTGCYGELAKMMENAIKNGEAEINSMPANILKTLNLEAADGTDVKTMKNKLKEYFLGKEGPKEIKGSDLSSAKTDIIRILDGNHLEVVKGAYNESRKSLDKAISAVKQAQKDYEGKDKDEKKNLATAAKAARRYGQLMVTVFSVQCDAIRKVNHEAFVIASRVALKAQKKEGKAEKKEEAKTESVDIFAW